MKNYSNVKPSKKDIELAKQFLQQPKEFSDAINSNTSITLKIEQNESYEMYWDRVRNKAKQELIAS